MTDFCHRKFDHPRQIRLLQLVSDSQSGTPIYDLLHISIDDDPAFFAVSYTWGDATLTHEINISGKSLKVTKSLYCAIHDIFPVMGALFRLSNPQYNDEIPLWIDGICINQSDNSEKGAQVAMMGEIYRQASAVVTYAGSLYEEARTALDLIRHCKHFYEENKGNPIRALGNGMRPEDLEQAGFPPKEQDAYPALRNLLRLPWSGRAWIVQESVMARQSFMIVGRTILSWTALASIAEGVGKGVLPKICAYGGEEVQDDDMGPDYVLMQAGLKEEAFTPDGRLAKTVCQLLRRCHCFASSDPRDKVYAFLSMAKDHEKIAITPDYGLPASDVYIDIATRILRMGESLDILSSVRPDKAIDLPSWVPDWSSFNMKRWGPNNYLRHPELLEEGLYRAGGAFPSAICPKVDGTELTLRGVVFDQLCLIVPVDCRGDPDPKYPNATEGGEFGNEDLYMTLLSSVQLILECCIEEMGANPYCNSGGVKEAFWRTLIANVDHLGHEAEDEYAQYYEDYAALQKGRFSEQFGHVFTIDTEAQLRAMRFATTMRDVSAQRQIGLTSKGYIASVPSHTEPGDCICVLLGGRVPFVVRPKAAAPPRHTLLGDVYVHGIMKGEATQGITDALMTDLMFN
ncbi:HET domain containing protein [Rhypophila decipiens]